MLRRLYHEQPESFAFTEGNRRWAEAQLRKFPDGRQASAIIPLLWRAQEQEGWLSRPAIEHVAAMLGMPYMRALEVATFYFMFQLQPVGQVAHFQICGTTSCMLVGAEDLIAVCKEKIAPTAHTVSADGKFSWEEVECLGACCNAPMAQIGKDYYEDLTPEGFRDLIDAMARGEVPTPGPQNDRFASEPAGGLTSLTGHDSDHNCNASVALAAAGGDTLKRIDGTEPSSILCAPIADEDALSQREQARQNLSAADAQLAASGHGAAKQAGESPEAVAATAEGGAAAPADDSDAEAAAPAPADEDKPELFAEAPQGGGDDLKQIKGIGPKLEDMLHGLGVWRFDQIAGWSDKEVAWVDYHLEGFKGRVERDDWVAQARGLVGQGGDATAQPVGLMSEPVADAPAEAAAGDVSAPTDDDKPDLFTEAPDDGGDDLKQIKGVGPKLEALLHSLGVWRFAQVASWSNREVAWVDYHLEGFKGRIERDDWVAQAKLLAAGEQTEFAKRVEAGDVPSSQG